MVRAQSVTATLVYTYNHSGLRVAQSVDGDPTSFSWDWATGVPEMLSAGDALYLVGHDTLGQWDDAWTYYLPDALGSVRQAADGAGAVVSAREWSPYGVEVSSAQTGLGYTGEWFDGYVGLVYLRARWYDVSVGRFTRRDPWEGTQDEPQTLFQGYVYVVNNPINFVDPSGLAPYIPPEPPNHRDLTYWLYAELSENANGYYIQHIRSLWASRNPADKSRALAAFYFLVKDRAEWDFKHQIDDELGQGIVLRDTNDYRWYEYSVPGNIHYGFVGRAAGFSGSLLHGGAGVAEIKDPAHVEAGEACCPYFCSVGLIKGIPYAICIQLGCYYINPEWWQTAFDEPGDWWNVEFGVQLFDAYSTRLTFDQFQDFLGTQGSWLTPASFTPEWNWINPKSGWPYETGRFDGPEARQNERWVRQILGGQP